MNDQSYLREAEGVITFEDLSRHIYILGGTGVGKTTLTRIIAKGLEEANETGEFGSSFIYVDLKGEDSWKFLSQIKVLNPDKVFFLDPVLTSFSVNPLELPSYSDEVERERVVSLYTGFLMKVLEEWYGASTEKTPRMLRIMRSLISYLYFKHDAPTLIDLYDLVIRIQKGDPVLLDDIERTLPAQSRPADVCQAMTHSGLRTTGTLNTGRRFSKPSRHRPTFDGLSDSELKQARRLHHPF
jgi:hypothetical protein